MKQLLNYLALFIIILNSGCGKQAFFYNIKRPTRLPPAPLAPLIPSRPLITPNNQAYSLIAIPSPSTAEYINIHQTPHIEPPSMTHTSYAIEHAFSVAGLNLGSSLYLNTIKIPDTAHTSYMSSVNITTPLKLNINTTSSPIININSSPLISYMNSVDAPIISLKSDINSNPLTDIKKPIMLHTLYMDSVNIDTSNVTNLDSPTTNIKTPLQTSYTNQVHINTLNATNLRPTITSTPSLTIDIKPSSPITYVDTAHINSPNLTNLQSDLNSIPATELIQTHSSTNIDSPSIQVLPPTFRLENNSNLSYQPQDIPNVLNINPQHEINVLQPIDVQPDIKTSFIIKQLPPKVIERKSQHEFHDTFSYALNEDSFFQSAYNKNKMTLFFQAFDHYGLNVRDLEKNNLHLLENQIEIESYTLSSQSQKLDHTLEVVFAIDTGGSMDEYGHIVKENITYFVNKLEETQLYTSFCFVAFKDLVKRYCNSFFPDNPLTPQNDNALKFLSDISRLEFQKGGSYPQNALGGVLSASQVPWSTDSQRIVILITDALFWTSVNKGESKERAPDYEDTIKALKDNNIQVFTLAQDYGGFSKDYFGHPSLSDATSGQWFDIKNLNDQDMDNILGQIRDQVDITYKIEYFVEDQEGLNALLPLEDRYISLTSNLAVSTDVMDIQIEDVHSSTPDGSQQLQSYWHLNQNTAINKNYVFVTVNEQPEYDFSIKNGEIVFSNPPPSGAEIFIQYEAGSLRNNIREHSLLLPTDPKHQDSSNIQINSVSLKLNNVIVSDQDFEITFSDASDDIQLHLSENVFDNTDPYNIRGSGELNISLQYEIFSQHNSIN